MSTVDKIPNVKLYSFDIFDTLITRETATPRGIFAIMQERIKTDSRFADLPRTLKENFYAIRIGSETFATTSARWMREMEVTFDEIYDIIAHNASLSPQQRQLLQDLEVELEEKHVFGISKNIEKLKKLVAEGKRVILISDMYLPEKHIRRMLAKADPIFEKLTIYISSDYGKGKWSGDLFQIVQKKENIEWKDWVHFGNDYCSDLGVPKGLDIHAFIYKYPNLTHFEGMAIDKRGEDAFVQLSVGAARNSRLVKEATWEDKKKGKVALGASIGGPVLLPYVSWVVEQAMALGKKRLYFIARDGYVLKAIADLLIKENNLDLQTHYIYGSRKAWKVPACGFLQPEDKGLRDDPFYWFFYNHRSNTVRGLFNNLEIDPEDVKPLLPWQFRNLDQSLDKAGNKKIANALLKDPKFKKLLNEKVYPKIRLMRERVSRYLQQEIDFSDDKMAFVELHGSGYTQDCLLRITKDFFPKPITTFFHDLMPGPAATIDHKLVMVPPMVIHDMLEALARSPQNQTIGYKEVNGKIEPVFETNGEAEAIIKDGVADYFEGVMDYVARCSKVLKNSNVYPVDTKLERLYNDYLFGYPDKVTATLIGRTPFQANSDNDKLTQYAPKLSFWTVLWGTLKQAMLPTSWYVGSIARSSPRAKWLMYRKPRINRFPFFVFKIDKVKGYGFLTIWGFRINFMKPKAKLKPVAGEAVEVTQTKIVAKKKDTKELNAVK